jgi:hypothetical protein
LKLLSACFFWASTELFFAIISLSARLFRHKPSHLLCDASRMAQLSHIPYHRPISESLHGIAKGLTQMLDKPEKTRELIATLEAAVPFEVALLPDLVEYLARQQKPVLVKPIETVSKVSYLGDLGGIICHVQPEDTENMIVVSLTHVRVPRTFPFATAVLDYQKYRVKKLKKQSHEE